ncbi:hypothetical protein D3C72_1454880 [compost metagenome]
MLEAGQQQHLAPGLFKQAHHEPRQGSAQQASIELLLHSLARQLRTCTAFFGITGALLKQLIAPPLITVEHEELGKQISKDHRIIGKVIEQTLDNLFHPHIQRIALTVVTGIPPHGRRGDFVEQAPRRMTAATEEALIQHRDLEHGDLHASDQGAQRMRQIAVAMNEVEKHRDQIDHIFVDHFDLTVGATLDADTGQ